MNHRFNHLLHLVVNALGLPGAGTLMAGHRTQGVLQILFSLLCMAGTLLGLVRLIHVLWVLSGRQANAAAISQWPDLLLQSGDAATALSLALGCALAYLANLLWSLTTARPRRPLPPPLPPTGG